MEKRLLLDLQYIALGATPVTVDDAHGAGPSPVRRPLVQSPALALVFRKGFAHLLQLTVQPR